MEQIIIYGINMQAQALCKMITKEQQAKVCTFVADSAYKKADELLGLPVYEAGKMKELFPPEQYKVCLSFGYKNMVRNREEKFRQCKQRLYDLYIYKQECKCLHIRYWGRR